MTAATPNPDADALRPARAIGLAGRPLAILATLHAAALAAATAACLMKRSPSWSAPIPHLRFDLAMALLASQACLLGLWAAFSGGRLRRRRSVLGLGALALTGLAFAASPPPDYSLALMPMVAAALFAGVALAFRLRAGTRLARVGALPPAGGREGLRFSIRGLMVLTLAVALVAGAVRALRDINLLMAGVPLLLTVLSVAIVAPALAAAWSALGLGDPRPRGLATLGMSLALAGLVAYALHVPAPPFLANVLIILAGPTPIVFGSLLLVRAAGFRLISTPPAPVEVADRHPLDLD